MPETHLLVIPLPNGLDAAGQARLSIAFAPRLVGPSPTGALRGYPWRDWPSVLNDTPLGIRIHVDGGQVPSFTVTSPPADPAVWAAVFGDPLTSETPVDPWTRVDRTQMPFPQAYSPSALAADALDVYAGVAAGHATTPPTAAELAAQPRFGSLVGDNLDDAIAFTEPLVSDGAQPPTPYASEFHGAITNLAAHPELLRLLGLVVDCTFPLPPVPTTVVTVRTNYAGLFPGAAGPAFQVRFRTHVDKTFRPLSNPDPDLSDQLDGFLPLAKGEYAISCLDTLGGARRLHGFRTAGTNGHPAPLPALREDGIAIIRDDMRTVLRQRFTRQDELEDAIADQLANPAQPAIDLYAEDVAQGNAYDVRVAGDGGTWRSLFDRHAPEGYRFPAADLTHEPEPDEGWAGVTLFTEANPVVDPSPEKGVEDRTPRRVHDAIFRWNGWSAATRLPGSMLDGATGVAVDQPANEPGADDPVQLAVDYRPVPGTLPRLRYGTTYDMRARCVDVAGNVRPVTDPEPDGAHLTETFGRLQPIEPPTVVRRSVRPTPGVGDTTTTLVIRSEHDQDDGTVEPTDRLLFPPRLSQHRVELHGQPDGGVPLDGHAFLAERDAADLSSQTVVDDATGEVVAGLVVGDTIEPGPERPAVVYLSDPATTGVGLRGLPGTDEALVAPYGDTWPDPLAVRVELRAGEEPPVVHDADAEASVTVWLPKAGTARVRVSSAVAEAYLAHFKLWHALADEDRDRLLTTFLDGRHWMVSPSDHLTLVHAVRLPLAAPAPAAFDARRRDDRDGEPRIGSVAAVFAGTVALDRASTADLQLVATWTDPVDDTSQAEPRDVTRSEVLGRRQVPLDDDRPDGMDVDGLRLDMGDTKRHEVAVTAEAFSRFSRYFTEQAEVQLSPDGVRLDRRGVVAASVRVWAGGEHFQRGVDFEVDGPRGLLHRLPRGAINCGVRLTVRYVPLPVSRLSSEHDSEPVTATVPSSARPLPPAVVEVLPAFDRSVTTTEDRVTVLHDAAVVRVRVARPWWSTGQGELLGVLCEEAGAASRVGRDPLVASDVEVGALTTGQLASASTSAALVDGVHDVAGHEVAFELDRGTWFTDVAVGGDLGYRPFVELLLARWQPVSLDGVALSSTVRTEPVRLGASRTVVVTHLEGAVGVEVTGPDADNELFVGVQVADPTIADPDLRWQATEELLAMTADPTGGRWTMDVPLPKDAKTPVRLLVEDREPTQQLVDGAPAKTTRLAYVETVEIPADWR